MKGIIKPAFGMLFLILFSCCSTFSFAQSKIKVKKLRYGICLPDSAAQPVALQTSPTGTQKISSGFYLVKQTNKIPAKMGQRFGVAYIIQTDPRIKAVEVECVWVYPTPITNPKGGVFKDVRYSSVESTNKSTYSNYSLDKEYEVVKGKWLLQLYYKKVKIFEQSFIVE